MSDLLEMTIPKDKQEEVKEFVSMLLLLSKEDRAVLLSNAHAFKVRKDIEKARGRKAFVKKEYGKNYI